MLTFKRLKAFTFNSSETREYELMTEAHAQLSIVRNCSRSSPKTLDKKTVQHNVDDDILTKQIFLGPKGREQKVENWSDLCGSQ